MKKLRRTILVLSGITLLAGVGIILFISPITRNLIERYDEEYTGRQISVDRAFVNPFTGYIHLYTIQIRESASDSIFFSADEIILNISLIKLFRRTYELSELSLIHPKGNIIQASKDFNFDDLIRRFSAKEGIKQPDSPLHLNILQIKIVNGDLNYQEQTIPIHYSINKINISCPGIRWDSDTIMFQFAFEEVSGQGKMSGELSINIRTNDYHLATIAKKFDLQIIGQYLKDLSNYGTFRANFDADIVASGNLYDRQAINAKGRIAINDMHIGKNPTDDYASFDKLVIAITELNPRGNKYFIDSITVTKSYFKYEMYDHLDNLQTMFGEEGQSIRAAQSGAQQFNLILEIAEYVKAISKNFLQSHYMINHFAINDGNILFNDYSINEKFSVSLIPLTITADSIDKNHDLIHVKLRSGINPYGHVSINLSINPKDSNDFKMQYNFRGLPISMFNPYAITYTSFPLDRGTMEFNGSCSLKQGSILSDNHLIMIDPRISKRIRNKDTKWIPLPLIMTLIRERGNIIDYNIPISGNLNNPKFHLSDVLIDLFKNTFIKPPTILYGLRVNNIEIKIEKSLSLTWNMRSSQFNKNQTRFLERTASYLSENPGATLTIQLQTYDIKERELTLYFEAKKKFFIATSKKNARNFNQNDSIYVSTMSAKDSAFIHYLDKEINDPTIFTVLGKCTKLIDQSLLTERINQINTEREQAFKAFFEKRGCLNQLKNLPPRSFTPFNGHSLYKIDFEGELPEYLLKAYTDIDELNNQTPRNKFKKERNKSRISKK